MSVTGPLAEIRFDKFSQARGGREIEALFDYVKYVFRRNQEALINSIKGLAWVTKSERMFREEIFVFLAGVVVMMLGWLDMQWGTYFLIAGFVMVTEILNTGLEKLCDMITLEHHDEVAKIKDAGSAAVFLAKMVFVFFVVAAILG